MRRLSIPAFFVLLLVCTAASPSAPLEGVTAADEAVLPSATDLLAAYPHLPIDPKLGTYSKRTASDGSAVVLRYNYTSPDGQPTVGVQATVVVAADTSVEKATYTQTEKEMVGAPPTPGVTREPRPDAMAWGDEHVCVGFIQQASKTEEGIACVARKGRAMLLVSFACQPGTSQFSHHHGMDELLAGRLQAIESYRALTVSFAEKAVVPNVFDVAAAYPSLMVKPNLGTYAKQLIGSKGFQVKYKYSSPDGQYPHVGVESYVAFLPTVSDARTYYAGVKPSVAVVGQTSTPGLTYEDRPDALAWGDEHVCTAFLDPQRRERGIMCLARKDRNVLVTSVIGNIDTAPLSHDHGMDKLLAKRLKALETYQP